MDREYEAIVAGHICLDLLPLLKGDSTIQPGKLIEAGPVTFHTGGAVANTGIALQKLGIRTRLMGKVGQDHFGKILLQQLRYENENIVQSMKIDPDGQTSYTIVLSPPGVDRTFFHCPGVNDTFNRRDIDSSMLEKAKLFHFGYPPLMRRMYENYGKGLVQLLKEAKSKGVTVSLDLAQPDPGTEAGKAPWKEILRRCLPYVDVFMPSIEEITYMLDRDLYEVIKQQGEDFTYCIDGNLLERLSSELLEMGAAIVGLKLGENGLYIRTTEQASRLEQAGRAAPSSLNWLQRELWIPCFDVKTVGTTGAGDCTIAGFLSGMLRSFSIEKTLQLAVGTGACNVEGHDATSTIVTIDQVQKRIATEWKAKESFLDVNKWKRVDDFKTIFRGPTDIM